MSGYDITYTGMIADLNGNGGSIPLDPPMPHDAERVVMTRDYCGAYTYRNGAIERILMGNGFMQDSIYFVQIKDYQGNVRAVLDQNHNLIERNEYYPYGGLINASDTQLQPYKYSAKELDRENGLDLYDSQARWFDPMLPQFNGVDALSEKKPWNSPYVYCGGNPILRVDPTGLDEWEINSKGDIVNHKKTKDHDAFYIVDEDKKRINGKELVFNYGKVTHRSLKSKILKKTYNLDIFEIKGDKYGTKLFEFMSDNITNTSYVEYSIVRTGSKTKGKNYISTGHEAGEEPALTHLIFKELYKHNIVVREIGHGHPLTKGADNADITFSKQANKIFKNSNRKIPKYFIYFLPLQKYIYFKSNSKPINK